MDRRGPWWKDYGGEYARPWKLFYRLASQIPTGIRRVIFLLGNPTDNFKFKALLPSQKTPTPGVGTIGKVRISLSVVKRIQSALWT